MNEEEIIKKVGELFKHFGVKSMTMDDISRKLGISKKTLYQFVSNKKDLVKRVVHSFIKIEQEDIIEQSSKGGNAIDVLIRVHQFVFNQVKVFQDPMLVFDLQKYHPEAYSIIKQHKQTFIFNRIVNNIDLGIKEGLYRKEIKAGLIGKLYLGLLDVIAIEGSSLNDIYSKEEIINSLINYHLRGVLSPKGIDYLNSIQYEKNK